MRDRRPKEASTESCVWRDNYIALRALLSRAVARFVGPHDIEDIVQETFVRSYAASRKQVIENPAAFMLRTARNLALNSLDRTAKKADRSLYDFLETEELWYRQTPESQYRSSQEFLVFCQAVATLPVKCRRVFILKKVYELSQKEIAAQLGISPSTVENHITRGMAITARYMMEKGYGTPASDSAAAPGSDSLARVQGK